jgi:hypothetical protein
MRLVSSNRAAPAQRSPRHLLNRSSQTVSQLPAARFTGLSFIEPWAWSPRALASGFNRCAACRGDGVLSPYSARFVRPEVVEIVAIAHHSQRPGYWKNR